MHKELVKNVFFVLVLNLLVKAIWIFGIDRNVQLTVGYSQYGLFQVMFNLSLIFQIILDLGITTYNSKRVAEKPSAIRTLLPAIFFVKLMLSLLYIAIIYVMSIVLALPAEHLLLLLGVAFIQILNSLLLYIRSNVTALQHFKVDGFLAVIDRLLLILICGSLLLYPQLINGHFTIYWFVFSQVLCYFVAVVLGFIYLLSKSPVGIQWHMSLARIFKVIKDSAPYALLIFLMSIYMRSDSIMIRLLSPLNITEENGIYASAFRLLDTANILGLMFGGILLPLFAKMLHNNEHIEPIIRTSVDILIPISFLVCILTYAFGWDIMNLLYDGQYVEKSATIFKILMLSFPAYCLMYIYSTLLTAGGNIKTLILISFIIMVVNLLLHFILIKKHGAIGAAIAVAITEWLAISFVIFSAHKIFKFPHDFRWIAKHICLIGSMIFITYLTSKFCNQNLFIKGSIITTLSLCLSLAFGIVKFNKIISLINKKG